MGILASGGLCTSAVGCMDAECHRCIYMYKPLDRDREEKESMSVLFHALHLLFQGKYLSLFMDVLKSFSFCPTQNKKHFQNLLTIMFVVISMFLCSSSNLKPYRKENAIFLLVE